MTFTNSVFFVIMDNRAGFPSIFLNRYLLFICDRYNFLLTSLCLIPLLTLTNERNFKICVLIILETFIMIVSNNYFTLRTNIGH